MSFLVATSSLPAVDRPNANRWNSARSCQKNQHVFTQRTVLKPRRLRKWISLLYLCTIKGTTPKCRPQLYQNLAISLQKVSNQVYGDTSPSVHTYNTAALANRCVFSREGCFSQDCPLPYWQWWIWWAISGGLWVRDSQLWSWSLLLAQFYTVWSGGLSDSLT